MFDITTPASSLSSAFMEEAATSQYSSNSCPSPFLGSSAVPFSWETRPGIPKQSCHPGESTSARLLPLPPPLKFDGQRSLSMSRKKGQKLVFTADPFVVALMECSKQEGDELPRLKASKVGGGLRRAARFFSFPNLYFSCKTTGSVLESTVLIPRSARETPARSFATRRG